jgi:hypothetical protein
MDIQAAQQYLTIREIDMFPLYIVMNWHILTVSFVYFNV